MKKNLSEIRRDFPTLVRYDEGEDPLHYLDNAATTLKPRSVLDAINAYYVEYPANIYRGSYKMSQQASNAYEEARHTVARFVGVNHPETLFFTSGTTASANLFIRAYLSTLQKGDEIVITNLEHNSTLLPWQILCRERGIVLKYLPFDVESGTFDLEDLENLFTPRTKLFSFVLVSNTLGVLVPFREMIRRAKEKGILCCMDVAQAVAHIPLELSSWGVDVAFFSGHKVFGPTGIGVLYIAQALAKQLPPLFFGGGIVCELSRSEVVYCNSPEYFEAGTPPIAQAIGLQAALVYLEKLGWETILERERKLSEQFRQHIKPLPDLSLYCDHPSRNVGIFSFNLGEIHPHDVATVLDDHNVAVRTGFHCTHLLLEETKIGPTVRASLAFYNTEEDILALRDALIETQETFHVGK